MLLGIVVFGPSRVGAVLHVALNAGKKVLHLAARIWNQMSLSVWRGSVLLEGPLPPSSNHLLPIQQMSLCLKAPLSKNKPAFSERERKKRYR